jgi:hypothetical protein
MGPVDVPTVVVLLVDRIETRDQSVARVVPTGPARPFVDAASVGFLAPPDGLPPFPSSVSGPRRQHEPRTSAPCSRLAGTPPRSLRSRDLVLLQVEVSLWCGRGTV